MRRSALLLCVCIAFATTCANAQGVDPATFSQYKDLTIETTGYGFPIKALRTAGTDSITIFYLHVFSGNSVIKSRTLQSDGSMSNAFVIASGIDTGYWKPFDVVLHPDTATYMVVFRKGNTLYARGTGQTGIPLATAKKINPYNVDFMALTWTSKKKFILFLERGGQVKGQLLRKKGGKKKSEVALTNVSTGEAVPLDAASDINGNALVVYAHFREAQEQADLKWLSVDKKLNGQAHMDIMTNLVCRSSNFLRNIYIAYDGFDDIFGMVMRVSPTPPGYCTFTPDGTFVQNPANLVLGTETPRALIFDSSTGMFNYFSNMVTVTGSGDKTTLYSKPFNPTGGISNSGYTLREVNNEIDFMGAGISRIGSFLVIWVNDGGPAGIYGRFWY